MGLETWASTAARMRRALVLVALVTTFAGVALVLDRPKGTILEWLAIPFLVLGGALFVWAVWAESKAPAEAPPSLARQFLRWLTLEGRLVPLFPAIGTAIILADVAYNWIVSASLALGTEDTIVLLGAASLLSYRFVPERYARERDFVLLFFVWLNAILVVPLLVTRLFYADFDRSVDVYSWVALAPETSALLNVLGVSNQVHVVAGATAPGLTFTPQHIAAQVTVVITTACSGIYSFGIFASAFVAYVLTEYERLSRRVWLLLGLGLLTAYVANVLRMAMIVLVGYYTDTAQTDLQNMLIAHSYAGWLIFLAWLSLFWGVIFRFAPPGRTIGPVLESSGTPNRTEARCAICSDVLTPIVPATRCTCGAYHHWSCITAAVRCPACGRAPRVELEQAAGGTES